MNTLIVHIIFGILATIFIIGIIIIITNAAKIKTFNNNFKSKLIEGTPLKLVYVKWELQNKLVPILPKPILHLPAPANKMKLINN